jgi:hypothetical protein
MHPIPCFRAPLTPGVGVKGQNYFKNLSAIKIYTYAKFHPDWSDGLDFYKVRIYIFCALYIGLFPFHKRKSMFAVMHSDINPLKSGLLYLTGQPYCKKSRSAKVKDGIINLILRNYIVDRYKR